MRKAAATASSGRIVHDDEDATRRRCRRRQPTEPARRRFPPRPTQRRLERRRRRTRRHDLPGHRPQRQPLSATRLLIELVITEVGGQGRVWNLTEDVVEDLARRQSPRRRPGQCRRMAFLCREALAVRSPSRRSRWPRTATSAAEFIKELKAKNLSTIRQQTRAHEEQTWEGAVTAMRGSEPAAPSQAARRIGTGHAGAGSVGAADGPMEPGRLASPAALRKEPEERPALVQRLSLRHPGRRNLHGPRGAGPDGLAQGRRGRIRPMGVAADGPELRRAAITPGRCPTVPTGCSPKGTAA